MLEKLRRRLPDAADADAALLEDLIEDAGRFICAYTRRDAVPAELGGAQIQLAAVFFNRMGMEGETRHDEGGLSRDVALLPEDIACQLRPYRLARAVGP